MTAAPLLLAAALAAHPQHVTLAEAEWNPETNSLEVALAISPSQLKDAVERHAGRGVDIDTDEKAVAAWLTTAFVVRPPLPAGAPPDAVRTPATLTYIGQELGVSRGWVYFEVPLPGGWEDAEISDRVRLIAEPQQHNTVVFAVTRPGPDGQPRRERASYTFDRQTPAHTLRAADLQPLKAPPARAAVQP